MAKRADLANPFTPAVAPVNTIAPCARGSIRFGACLIGQPFELFDIPSSQACSHTKRRKTTRE